MISRSRLQRSCVRTRLDGWRTYRRHRLTSWTVRRPSRTTLFPDRYRERSTARSQVPGRRSRMPRLPIRRCRPPTCTTRSFRRRSASAPSLLRLPRLRSRRSGIPLIVRRSGSSPTKAMRRAGCGSGMSMRLWRTSRRRSTQLRSRSPSTYCRCLLGTCRSTPPRTSPRRLSRTLRLQRRRQTGSSDLRMRRARLYRPADAASCVRLRRRSRSTCLLHLGRRARLALSFLPFQRRPCRPPCGHRLLRARSLRKP